MTRGERAAIHDLLARLAGGDRTAIEPAFAAIWPFLRAFTSRALRDDSAGEDAAQEAMVKLFAQVATFDTSRDGLAWAITIAAYEVRTARRRAQRRREDALDRAPERATHDSPEASVVERDLTRAARDVLAGLHDDDVATILSALADTRPAGDATFRKRLERALARFRSAWKAKHEAP